MPLWSPSFDKITAFEGETVIFADDTNIFVTGNNEEETYYLANKVLKCVSIYMKVYQLHINTSKCAHMYYVLEELIPLIIMSFTILVHVQKHILNTWPRKTLILNTLNHSL